MSKNIDIGVVILNFNSWKDTIELYKQILSYNNNNLSILVIDNASNNENLEQLKKEIPLESLLINERNLGYAGGNNIGIENSINNLFEFTLILNPDIRLTKNTIQKLLETIKNDSLMAAVGPRICYREQPDLIYSDGGQINPEDGYLSNHINYNTGLANINTSKSKINEVDYVNGSCILIRNEVIKSIGSFKDLFFLYFEETEWCLRAKEKGFSSYVTTEAIAYHTSSDKGRLYYFYMIRNRLLLATIQNKHYKYTRNKIFKTLLKDFSDSILKGKKNDFWGTKFKGFLSGIFTAV